MHRALEAHVACLNLNTRLFRNCLDGLTEQAVQQRQNGEGNSISFIAVHLVDARLYLAWTLGADISNPFGKELEQADGIDDVEQLPMLDELRTTWIELSRHLLERMVAMPEDVMWSA